MVSRVSVTLIRPILQTLVFHGYDVGAFFGYASMEQTALHDSEAQVRVELLDNLLNAASAFCKDEQFGLELGRSIEISSLGILGYVLQHAETLGHALLLYQRYNSIVCSGIDIQREEAENVSIIRFEVVDPERQVSRHAIESVMCSLYQILIKLSCRKIVVKDIDFAHSAAGADVSRYVSVFGVRPRFGQSQNVLRLEEGVYEYPILFSDGETRKTFERYAEQVQVRMAAANTFVDQVTNYVFRCIPATIPSIHNAAEYFHVSVRTLQSHLRKEQTTYRTLFNKARMELAARYLTDPNISISEIAYLLHFSEPSAFQYAFKKWSGHSPGQFRKSLPLQRARSTVT